MTVQDYRIGNFCLKEEFPGEGKQVWTINAGDLYDHCQDGKPLPEPIPLTPEWLERLGLIRQVDRKIWIKGKCAIVWYDGSTFNPAGYYLAFKDMGNVLYHTQCTVDYVHQVQNGFAVAGEELKDKP